jgi:hypothetical protein
MSSGPTPEKPENDDGTRQERRAGKLRKKKERMKQHGKGLVRVYRDAVAKRKPEKSGEKEPDGS